MYSTSNIYTNNLNLTRYTCNCNKETMRIEEIREWERYEYQNECDVCGLTQTILSSHNNGPEYEHDVYLKCQCGNFLHFVFPVN
jgi:hypothetical protein